jgi:TonB dependent receptor
VDVIGEFKLISNPYTAVYGRSPGAVVDVTTKGGTNEVHGLLFEYLRNRVLDANDFFSNRSGLPKPANVQNQFGGNVGAPIIRNKLFGFFNYEGTRIRRGITRISTVPLANERVGDFSPAAAAANGVTYPKIIDPTTGQQFANNTIPTNRLDPYGLKLMSLFPVANQPGQVNNYARTGSLIDDNDSYDGRVDWNANDSNLVFVRYTGSSRIRDIPGYFGGIADGTSTSAWGNSTLKSYSAVLGWTRIFGPTLTNDFRVGYVRNFAYDQQQPFGQNAASAYVPGVPDNLAVAGGVSQTTFNNFTFIGSPDFLPKQQVPQQFQYTDTLSWSRGSHSLKFGVDVRAPMRNIYQDEASTRGTLTFSGTLSGLSYADGLLGYVYQGTLNNVLFVDQRLWMASGFAQDDWKVTPKLTLNLGVRYDFATPAYSGNNQQANFDASGSGSLVYATGGSLGDRSLMQVNKTNIAPRFGLAYAANDKTVIRGGYGIYNLLFQRAGSENQLALNPPYLRQTTLLSNGNQPAFLLQNGFPANLLDPSNINLALAHIRAQDPNSPTPYVQQWSIGIQRQLPGQLVFTTDYVGTKSTHLDIIHDLNQYVNGAFPYPNFGYLEYQQSLGNGSYNGLETSLQRRFANGLSLEAAYTYSKSIQTTYEQTFTRAVSSFDIPHRFVFSYVFELPFGKGKPFLSTGIGAAVLGGWRSSGVYTYSTGLPFTVTSGSNYSNAIDAYGAATAVPNVIGTPTTVGNVGCWFYVSANKACTGLAPNGTNAFALQPMGAYGNAGVNILRGPHATVFDFSLMRDFRIREKMGLQFRWEVFNLTNTPMFSLPNSNLSSGSVGTITSLAGDPRVMQAALRLSF